MIYCLKHNQILCYHLQLYVHTLFQDDKNYFRSEAALLQQLHHPRVVLLMGVCSTASRPFMLLEYMMGGSLHTLIHGENKAR